MFLKSLLKNKITVMFKTTYDFRVIFYHILNLNKKIPKIKNIVKHDS